MRPPEPKKNPSRGEGWEPQPPGGAGGSPNPQAVDRARLRDELFDYLQALEPRIAYDLRQVLKVRNCEEAHIEAKPDYFMITTVTNYPPYRNVQRTIYVSKLKTIEYLIPIDYVDREGNDRRLAVINVFHIFQENRRLCFYEIRVHPRAITADAVEDLLEAQGV